MITERLLGKTPDDWEIVRLKKVLTSLGNGVTATQNKNGEGYAVTRIETIAEEEIDPKKVGYVSELSEQDLDKYRMVKGDILFSHINSLEHIGKTAIYEGTPKRLIHGMNLLMLRPNRDKVHAEYLLYLLKTLKMRDVFKAMAKKAVNQASINQTQLGRLKIPLPSLSEQRRIAEVLSCVDDAIQRVNGAIAKTKRLKKGLMQKLLTEGIEHKEFQETKIGKIPSMWKIAKLGDIANISTGSTPPTRNPEYYNGEIPFVKTAEIDNNIINRSSVSITKRAVKDCSLRIYPPKTILLAMYGQGKTRGKASLLNTHATTSQNAAAIVLDGATCNPMYMWYYLVSKYRELRRTGIHGHISHLNLGFVRRLEIPVPPLVEQQKIVEVLSTVDYRLELDIKRKEKLVNIKKGLMNDLLSGKVRVKVD